MMWALLLTALNPTMYQLHRQLNPFLASAEDNRLVFAKRRVGCSVSHCGVVSVDKPSLTLSPTTPNQLIMLIGSDALSLDAGGR